RLHVPLRGHAGRGAVGRGIPADDPVPAADPWRHAARGQHLGAVAGGACAGGLYRGHHGGGDQPVPQAPGLSGIDRPPASRPQPAARVQATCWTRPRSELVSASVITTSTNCPIRRGGAVVRAPVRTACPRGPVRGGGAGEFTERVFSVFAVRSVASFCEGPVTSTRCTVPAIARDMPAAYSLMCACRRDRRACFTSSG